MVSAFGSIAASKGVGNVEIVEFICVLEAFCDNVVD